MQPQTSQRASAERQAPGAQGAPARREAHTPATATGEQPGTVLDLVGQRILDAPEHPMFSRLVRGDWTPVSSAAFGRQSRALAAELVESGIGFGDRVAILSATRYEWALIEFACLTAGAILVPIYDSNAPAQIAGVLADCGAVLVFAETDTHVERLAVAAGELRARELPEPGVRRISDLDADALEASAPAPETLAELDRRRAATTPETVATLVYSSGTTGEAKGSRITNANFVGLATNIIGAYSDVIREDSRTIVFLPLAHVLARSVQLVGMYTGMTVGHLGDPKDLVGQLPRFKPTFLMVVPRLLEKIEAGIARKAGGGVKGAIFAAARRTAIRAAATREAFPGRPLPAVLRVQHALSDRLVYGSVREALGGELDALLSGASALDPNLARFFSGAGLPVIEGYGLTETTAPITGNPVGAMRFGTVGIPVPGATVRIADDGEILVRGPGVITSYWREALNEGVFTDGFFRTGDLGELDADGYLTVTGRAKDLIVTAYGKNVAPEPLERSIARETPLIAQAVVVGEGQPYLGALVSIDREELGLWAEARGLALGDRAPEDIPELLAAIDEAVARANALVSSPEQVKRFRIIPEDFTEENGALTPTQKLKRAPVVAGLAERIRALYAAVEPPREGGAARA